MVRRLTRTLAVTPTLPRALTLSLTPTRYAAAASGPKDVVLVIGSMAGGIMTMAKHAAKMVIDTLTAVDYVTIVKYHFAKSAGAEVAYSSALVEATDANKDQLKTWIDRKIDAQGGGVWKQVFMTAFEVMDATTASSNCNRIMLFLSDGGFHASWTDDDSEWVRSKAASYDPPVHLLTYGFGVDAKADDLKAIACAGNGIYYSVRPSTLANTMASYFQVRIARLDG